MQDTKFNQLFNLLERRYRFEGFVHYTAYDNLKSILESGYLLSRRDVVENNINFIDVAWDSVLQGTSELVKTSTRFMYNFNTPISYRFEQNARDQGTEMIALVFNKNIVLDYATYFYEKSPAIYEKVTPYMNLDYVLNFNWKEIFERGPYKNEEEKKKKRPYRDAEITVLENVTIEYLDKIYFRSKEYYDKAVKELGNNKLFRIGQIGTYKQFAEI